MGTEPVALRLDELYPGLFYHKVAAPTQDTMAHIRGLYHSAALMVLQNCPASRERDIAMTHLEESLMRAIQSLAIHGGGSEIQA